MQVNPDRNPKPSVHGYDTMQVERGTLILSYSLETDPSYYGRITTQLEGGQRTLYLKLTEEAMLEQQGEDGPRYVQIPEDTALKVTQATPIYDDEEGSITGLEMTLEDQKGTKFTYATGQKKETATVDIVPYRIDEVEDQKLLVAEELTDNPELRSSAIASFVENSGNLFLAFPNSGFLVKTGKRSQIPTGESTAFRIIQMITMNTIMEKPLNPNDDLIGIEVADKAGNIFQFILPMAEDRSE